MAIKRAESRKFFFKYTMLFGIMLVFLYGYFVFAGKSLIYNGDGILQHYRALCYYAKWMREIVRTLLTEYRLVIPEWSFSIGYGSDIAATLHYYVMGDPFNLPAILVPVRYMKYYYMLMIFVRMYCAGMAFSVLCRYFYGNSRSDRAVLAGTFLYVFCTYGMRAGITHPYFINTMIYFPLLILGTEKIIRKEKPYLFIVMVCISACSNFYFFYMLAILTGLYGVSRLIARYGLNKPAAIVKETFRLGLYAIWGLALGAVLFLPVMLNVLQDTRMSGGYQLDLLYPSGYYRRFPGSFLSYQAAGYWSMMGFAGMGLIAVMLLFIQKRKRTFLRCLFVAATGCLMIPAAGWFLNGCSYTANRWIWAYALLVAVILVEMWPDLLHMHNRERSWLTISLGMYVLLCLGLDNSRTENVAFCIGFLLVSFCVLQLETSAGLAGKVAERKEQIIVFLILLNVSVNAYYGFSPNEGDYPAKYVDLKEVNKQYTVTQDVAVAQASPEDSGFFRYAQNEVWNNSTLASGLHSIQYYWSLSNSAIVTSNASLGILNRTHNNYLSLNERTGLSALANVHYFTETQGRGQQYAPYGYEYEGTYSASYDDKNMWDVYKNQYPLSFGYTYDSVLDKKAFAELNPVEKEEAMLQSALLEGGETEMPAAEFSLQSEEKNYEIECSDNNVSVQGNSFVTTKKNASVILTCEGLEDGELYLLIEGLEYKGCSPLDLYEEESPFDPLDLYKKSTWEKKSRREKAQEQYKYRNWTEPDELLIQLTGTNEAEQSVVREIRYYTPKYSWYAGQRDFAVNMGYSEGGKRTVKISFPEAGIYSFENMRMICQPMDGYEERIADLNQEHLEDVTIGNDTVTGNITNTTRKILCLTIPYTRGWEAWVDGKKTDIYKTNMMYMGLELEPGEHQIQLRYRTPGMRFGAVLSLLSAGMLLATWFLEKNKKRTK